MNLPLTGSVWWLGPVRGLWLVPGLLRIGFHATLLGIATVTSAPVSVQNFDRLSIQLQCNSPAVLWLATLYHIQVG